MGRSPSPPREAAAPPSDLPEERESSRSTEQQPPRQREEVRRPAHAPTNPTPNNVLGVFGLSIRTTERDLDDEFGRHGRVEKVVIVYDQRVRVRLPRSRADEASRSDREDSDS